MGRELLWIKAIHSMIYVKLSQRILTILYCAFFSFTPIGLAPNDFSIEWTPKKLLPVRCLQADLTINANGCEFSHSRVALRDENGEPGKSVGWFRAKFWIEELTLTIRFWMYTMAFYAIIVYLRLYQRVFSYLEKGYYPHIYDNS